MERLTDLIAPWIAAVPPIFSQAPPLLLAAAGAMALVMAGGLVGRVLPFTGRFVRLVGNLALIAVFCLAVLRFVRLDSSFDGIGGNFGMPAQMVQGGETRVPLSADGHYWIDARVNGTRQRFMVDTGATLTAISEDVAESAGIAPDPLRLPVVVRTANGAVEAQLARIGDVRFGSIIARDMDAIVTGSTGGLNVLGMNFLSRLKAWRVEDGVLILTPKHPVGTDTPPAEG